MREALATDEPVATATRRAELERLEVTESAPSSSAGRPLGTGGSTGGSTGTIEPSSIHTKAEFYQWFSAMEATRASEVEAKYKQHAEAVEKQIEVCNELLGDIGSVLDIFSELKLSQRAISGRTDALKEQCDRLVSEREKLSTVSGSIKERLDHFDRLEELSSLFHAPVSASSDPQAILQGLEDLDTSLAFTSKHPEYLESAKYHAKFRNLQARALALVKSYFQESMVVSIAECKASTLHDVEGGAGSGHEEGLADGGDMTIQNVKFRAIAEPRLKELMAGVCSRSDRPTYEQLIKDCSTAYCKARFELVRYGVLAAMQKLTTQADVQASTPATDAVENTGTNPPADESTSSILSTSHGRVGSTTAVNILTGGSDIISRTAEEEVHLYRHIFPGSSYVQAAAMLFPLFDSMCILLAAVIEPVIYSTLDGDVQGMCRINAHLVRLVRHETLGAVFNVPSLNKLVQVVERMIIRQAKSDWKKSVAESSALPSADIASPLAALLEPADMDFLRCLQAPLDVSKCRAHGKPKPFEPVVRGVQMITSVQESVGGSSALELIGDIVPGLLDVVHRASELSGAPGSSESSETSEAYGAIFALRQLCLLSQCLDSSHLADLDLGRNDHGKSADRGDSADGVATGDRKRGFVSSLSSRIPLLASFSSLASRSMQGGVGRSGADIVAIMEKKLAVARDFCILTCAQDATNPLLSFLTKVTAAKVSGREQVKSHAFATLERVKQLGADVRTAIEGPILKHIALLHMVMPEPELSSVLEAIRANLEDALMQMQDIVTAEYTAEEAQDIDWISYEEIWTLLFDETH